MKHASTLAILALLGLAAVPAQAARPTWSYLELDYLDTKSPGDVKAKGGRFNFNVSLENWLYFTGEYNHADFEDSDLQLRDTSLGFGAHTLDPAFQVFGAMTYERNYVFGTNDSDSGYATQFGLRWPLPFVRSLELGADAKWYNFDDAGRRDRSRGTLQWKLGPTWTAIGTYQATSVPGATEKAWTLGFRAYFITQYDLPPRKPVEPAAPAANP